VLEFNLEYLRAFYYSSQLGSLTKASEALFVSQPALSHSIKQLEAYFKCELFTRTSRGVKLTYEGELLFSRVSKAFAELLSGEGELASLSNFPEKELRIGTTETALHHFLIPKIEQFKNTYPKVHIHVTGSSSSEAVQMLMSGKVDLSIVVSPISDSDELTTRKIFSFNDVFIAGPKYENLRDRIMTPHDICEYPIASVEVGTSARAHIDEWFRSHSYNFTPEYSVRTSSAIIPFVEMNLAVGIIPSMFVEESISKGKVFKVDVKPSITSRQLLLVYKTDMQMTALGRAFVKHIVE